ncbi:MAG: hypothetical protein QGG36_00890 [Pirellulaceae bacterium]|nr:hypothetical protein [Pirellulaceae bacterium]
MSKKLLLCLLINVIGLTSAASAHYLWVTIDKKAGDHGVTNIYFEGGAGDGQYLDPFLKAGKTWLRTVENTKPRLLKTTEAKAPNKRWLSAQLSQQGPRSIDSYGKWGVYRYGETDVLLHYYGRHLDVQTHEDLHELGRAELMNLDIVPHDAGADMKLTVLWKGQPVADRLVYVRGPQGFKKNAKTNAKGEMSFTLKGKGRYTFRTNVEQKATGKDGEKSYSLIRHHATMVMQLPLEK